MRFFVISVFMNACESLTRAVIRAAQKNTNHGNWCYRKIPIISYKNNTINEKVCAKIQQVTGPHEDILTIVKGRKLKWYGHTSRLSRVWPKPSCKVSEWGKKTRQTQKEGSGEQRKMEGTGCEIICGAQTTPASKG